MNLDAAFILQYLQQEKVGRKPATIMRKTGLTYDRVMGALILLEAVDKVEKLAHDAWQTIDE